MRVHFAFTWSDWWPLLIYDEPQFPEYVSVGLGPFYLEFYWGAGLAPWEQ